MTFQDVLDLFNVREVLEIEAAKKAVPNCYEGEIIRLSAMLEKSGVALERGKPIESIRLARTFHTALAELGGNRLLLDMLKGINERIHMVGLTILRHYPERPLRVLEENHRILSALKVRDAHALELALREHIARSRELIVNGRWEQQVT
jgi:DNA-binding GntR family transcriptional regulator